MPGEALPDESLATANLPMVVEMVDQALEGSVLLRKPQQPPDAPGEGTSFSHRLHDNTPAFAL